jgi:hypothetical protein
MLMAVILGRFTSFGPRQCHRHFLDLQKSNELRILLECGITSNPHNCSSIAKELCCVHASHILDELLRGCIRKCRYLDLLLLLLCLVFLIRCPGSIPELTIVGSVAL